MSRSVLVTGGNRGIGLATARLLAQQGHRVAVTYRTAPPEGLLAVRCDVTSTAEVDAAFTEVEAAQGPVEILVSNAGLTQDGLLLRMSEASFTDVLDANLTGAYRVAKRASRSMLKARHGRLLFVSSVVGLSGATGQANYAASKSGLFGLTKTLARESAFLLKRAGKLDDDGVGLTVNTVAPGFIATEMLEHIPEKVLDGIKAKIPLGRLGRPEEIGRVVHFLCADASSYITGQVWDVNGGMDM